MLNTFKTQTEQQEFRFREADFRRISNLVRAEAGIHLTQGKAPLVYSRLTKRLRALHIKNFATYVDLVDNENGIEERRKMISALTTNVTKFYREAHHFQDLRERVLPRLIKTARKGGKVRIWSNACSSGEEIYSVAFEVLSLAPDANNLDIKLLGTDLDPVVLESARIGEFSEKSVGNLPSRILDSDFISKDPDSSTWQVSPKVKNLIAFRKLNLIQPWPLQGPFDVVFCRNVTIYFDLATRDQIWARIFNVLAVGGQLYMGHSERISESVGKRLRVTGITGYARPLVPDDV